MHLYRPPASFISFEQLLDPDSNIHLCLSWHICSTSHVTCNFSQGKNFSTNCLLDFAECFGLFSCCESTFHFSVYRNIFLYSDPLWNGGSLCFLPFKYICTNICKSVITLNKSICHRWHFQCRCSFKTCISNWEIIQSKSLGALLTCKWINVNGTA